MVKEPKIEEPTVEAPSIFIPEIKEWDEWEAPSRDEIRRIRRESKNLSVVVYAPKYDTQLREEAEIIITSDGKFEVTITKVGQNTSWKEDLGTFNTYEDAKAILFDKFDELFNRPSELAIQSGANPNWKVWDEHKSGRQRGRMSPAQVTKRSVSIIEGEDEEAVTGTRVTDIVTTPKGRKLKDFNIRVPKVGVPSVVSIRSLYPSYFENLKERHKERLKKLRRKRRR